MDLTYLVFSIGPQFLLFLAAIKFHQVRKLPKLLLAGLILVLIFSLPMALHLAVGAEHLQTLLSDLFPNANNPDGLTDGTSYRIGDVAVGPLYMRIFEISHYITSIPVFFVGLGFLQFARREIQFAAADHLRHLPS